MNSPKFRSESSDKPKSRGRQPTGTDNSVGERIIEALGDNSRAWLAEETGLPESTIGDAIRRGPSRADVAVKIARALKVDLEWMLTGATASRDGLPERVPVNSPETNKSDMSAEERRLFNLFNRLSSRERGVVLNLLAGLSGAGTETAVADLDRIELSLMKGAIGALVPGQPDHRRLIEIAGDYALPEHVRTRANNLLASAFRGEIG